MFRWGLSDSKSCTPLLLIGVKFSSCTCPVRDGGTLEMGNLGMEVCVNIIIRL